MTQFDDIRPYRDDEVRAVIDKLTSDNSLVDTVANYKFPRMSKWVPGLMPWLIRKRIQHDLGDVNSVKDFQDIVANYVARSIKTSTSGFSFTGIDKLDPKQSYLFISNHRDIAMDPAFLNYALYLSNHNTFEIAIGDNLLTHPLATDLMRLNRTFIVKRSVEGIRNKLAAMTQLSHYIRHTLDQKTSVWIAQREGRAKNGIDKTDPTILKMFYIHGKKQRIPFSEYINQLNIVPVAISYEYDPCDYLKAKELEARSHHQDYEKSDDEDLQSIIKGIAQPKGRVHVGVGTPLKGEFENADQVAALIDQQIAENYQLYVSNIVALERLALNWKTVSSLPELTREKMGEIRDQAKVAWNKVEHKEFANKAREFSQRVAEQPHHLQQYMLEMYANPIINKYQVLKAK